MYEIAVPVVDDDYVLLESTFPAVACALLQEQLICRRLLAQNRQPVITE